MIREELHHGFSESHWISAKEEAKAILVSRAKVRGMIAYSELVGQITSIRFTAHDARFFHLLGEISYEEDLRGRGMLTAIVVHKNGDMEPGPGFFELAKMLGRDVSDTVKCWIEELHKVHSIWSRQPK